MKIRSVGVWFVVVGYVTLGGCGHTLDAAEVATIARESNRAQIARLETAFATRVTAVEAAQTQLRLDVTAQGTQLGRQREMVEASVPDPEAALCNLENVEDLLTYAHEQETRGEAQCAVAALLEYVSLPGNGRDYARRLQIAQIEVERHRLRSAAEQIEAAVLAIRRSTTMLDVRQLAALLTNEMCESRARFRRFEALAARLERRQLTQPAAILREQLGRCR